MNRFLRSIPCAAALARRNAALGVALAVVACQSGPAASPEAAPPGPREVRTTRPSVEPIPPVQGLVDRTFQDPRVGGTGAVLGVLHDGEPVVLEAWGRPSGTSPDSLAVDAVFPFPEMTGVLVAMVVRALDTSGRVDAQAPIGELVADLPPEVGRMTLDQLLRHTGGLDDARVPDGSTIEGEVAGLGEEALFAPPGVAYSVSRYSVPLAVRVLERHFQLPLSDIVDRAIITPLGLSRSTLDAGEAQAWMEVTGYTIPEGGGAPTPVEPPAVVDGLPVFYTTVPEILTLFRAWMDGSIGSAGPGTVLQASPGVPHRDFFVDGFRARPHGAFRELTPSDGIVVQPGERGALDDGHGFRATARVVPGTGTVVVSWANASRGEVTSFPRRVADLVVQGLLGPAGPSEVHGGPETPTVEGPLTDWTGRYLNGHQLIVLREPETLPGVELAYWDGAREIPMEWAEDGRLVGRLPNDGRIAVRLVPFVGSDGRRYLHHPAGRTFGRQDQGG